MMVKSILDTDILSEYLKSHNATVAAHAERYAAQHGSFSFTSVTVYEIAFGLELKGAASQLKKVLAWLEKNEQITPVDGDYLAAATIKATARKQAYDCRSIKDVMKRQLLIAHIDQPTPIHPVRERLGFAERRFNELRNLNAGDLAGAPSGERQSLIQEFFFHLCGAIDFLAQEVNNIRKLGLNEQDVSPSKVVRKLPAADPIRILLSQLHPTTQNKPLPGGDPYSEECTHFRVLMFRNFVSHIRNNPFSFQLTVGSRALVHLFVDPRLPHQPKESRTPSKFEAFDELKKFLDLVRLKCNLVLKEMNL